VFLNEVVELANGSVYRRQLNIARRRRPRDEPENQCFPDSPSWGPVPVHQWPGKSWPSSLQPRIGKFVGIGRGTPHFSGLRNRKSREDLRGGLLALFTTIINHKVDVVFGSIAQWASNEETVNIDLASAVAEFMALLRTSTAIAYWFDWFLDCFCYDLLLSLGLLCDLLSGRGDLRERGWLLRSWGLTMIGIRCSGNGRTSSQLRNDVQ
jgi:hypothetical protein